MSELINYRVANALATLVLATGSYTILDRLANAIAIDAVNKGVYELSRSLEVILRNPKEDQRVSEENGQIVIESKWKGELKKFTIRGGLPDEGDYSAFISQANKDIRVARQTAAYAAALMASKVSEALKPSRQAGESI
jgi:CRISPR type I-A-associated protein Csa5